MSAKIYPSLLRVFVCVFVCGFVLGAAAAPSRGVETGWKAGVATADITPDQPQWIPLAAQW